ncbi:hypothetical protein GQ55_4G169400 [Panicum hallii var. hallii]|uniref:Uncharacterized protein n=1 Tax=Panicum hallii var. hallii TaxID=1504633 RepID=A0A2T7DYQ7_9POAL|nr:hypothetical protein GQ55_4G169400 [Panicum hallii var. hallii]
MPLFQRIFFILAYPTSLVVLSNLRGTKFVVGTSLSHCIFMFIRRKRICDFPNWKIEMKPFLFSLSRSFCII